MRLSRLYVLLFSLCLSATLLLNGVATAFQSTVPSSDVHDAQSLSSLANAPTDNALTGNALTDNVDQTTLANGLTVLTKEVHTSPVVSVQVWYDVGAVNEAPAVNGITHQLEHMLFKGTQDRPIQFGHLFNALGSHSNAFTSYDETAYFNTAEQHKLKALLTLESDRMQHALIAADDLQQEKQVVISELHGAENRSSYRLFRAVMQAALPHHPYGRTIIGSETSIEHLTVQQVQDYYRRYYRPDHAVLVVVGDFETASALEMIDQTFGQVAPYRDLSSQSTQAIATPLSVTPAKFQQASDSSPAVILHEPGNVAMIRAIYPLPDINHPDGPALDVMDYIMDHGGRSARIYQALVESGQTSDAGSGAAHLKFGGWWSFYATATPGQDLSAIDQVFQQLVTDLQNQPVSLEELDRAKANIQAQAVLGYRDITNQAMQLGADQIATGDYGYTDRYLQAIAQVSAADVQRVAQTYLQPGNRTVGFFEPTEIEGEDDPVETNFSQPEHDFSAGGPMDPAQVAQYLPPIAATEVNTKQPVPEAFSLSNGLRVLLLPDASAPAITLSGYIRAGQEFDPETQTGLASLTADNLMNGTQTQDKLTLAKRLEDRGADLWFGAGREGVYLGGSSLDSDQSLLLQTLSDVLQHATFPSDQLELSCKQNLTQLKQAFDSSDYVAWRTFHATVYPANHPFHRFATEASLSAINREDVLRFYQTYYRPNTTVLTVVGNFKSAQMRSQLETLFDSWTAGSQLPTLEVPPAPLPTQIVHLTQALPGKAEAVTYMGHPGIDRQDPRFYAALVFNKILGGDTLSSRLGAQIRDRLGLTYGIYSDFHAGIHAGPFSISMQTAPQDVEQAIATTLALLQQVRDQGVTAAEVETAKHSITSSYRVALADPDYLSTQVLWQGVYGLPPSELHEFCQKIDAITVAEVNQVASTLLHPDQMVIVTAGPKNSE
ncbi:MAG: insulinase family protein [Cyanothece sp. SIO1E1]|nr:insulinase family protein [Cyanothece sp. SIO1E1]